MISWNCVKVSLSIRLKTLDNVAEMLTQVFQIQFLKPNHWSVHPKHHLQSSRL